MSDGEHEALGELVRHFEADSSSVVLRSIVGATVEAVTLLAERNAKEVREILEMKALLLTEEETLPVVLRRQLTKMREELSSEWIDVFDSDEEALLFGKRLAASEDREGKYSTPVVDEKRGRPATFMLYSDMKEALDQAANLVDLGTQAAMRYTLHYLCAKANIAVKGAAEKVTLSKK